MTVLKKRQMTSKETPKALDAPDAVERVRPYKFDSFLLDKAERVLLRGKTPIMLPPKVFDILCVLVERAGHLVTKEVLMEKVWPDTFVEEANLSVNIAALRRALGENPNGRSYIKTVRKRGYRFVANVTSAASESALKVLTREQESAVSFSHEREWDSAEIFNSLAVLPFDNETGDPHAEYLSDGLTESIMNSLSNLEGIRVLGRNTVFRYKGKSIDSQKVGEQLGVRCVLTGRILRLDDRVIVRTEVIAVNGGWQIWGGQYHRTASDILAVQEEIAQEISGKLRLKLTADEKRRLTKRHSENSTAFHFYLKGRYHWNKYAHKGLGRAIDCFKRAIEEDPTYALAYAGLSDSYYRLSNLYLPTTEAMPKARAAAQRALEIDDTLGEAHSALGVVLLLYDWDWTAAKRELSRALELNPGYAIAHLRMAQYFNLVGDFSQAMRQYQIALELDPLSPAISSSVALEFSLMGDYEQAVKQAERSLAIEPNYHPTHYFLGWVHKRKGDLRKALESFERVTIMDDAPHYMATLAYAHGLNGDRTNAMTILKQLEERSKHEYVSSYCRAVVFMGLDERDLAFRWLEKAVEERSEMIPWLTVGADCDDFREDPRFDSLLRRCGLDGERARSLQS